jgi:hypothetical protein
MRAMHTLDDDIAATAARLVVEEGLEYGPAKTRAVRQLGLPARTRLPDNAVVEAAVREHIAIFCADTQPAELRALREMALVWMDRLALFQPHISGAVWHGTATRLNDVFLQLFCDDPKAAEIHLLNQSCIYEVGSTTGFKGEAVDVLSIRSRCAELNETVGVHLLIYDTDDLRGALKPDAQGRKPRGDASALRHRLAAPA